MQTKWQLHPYIQIEALFSCRHNKHDSGGYTYLKSGTHLVHLLPTLSPPQVALHNITWLKSKASSSWHLSCRQPWTKQQMRGGAAKQAVTVQVHPGLLICWLWTWHCYPKK